VTEREDQVKNKVKIQGNKENMEIKGKNQIKENKLFKKRV
jgi:hypothetical protein